MTREEMTLLQQEFGEDLRITKAVHLHDDPDCGNEFEISYRGIIVGSELVDYDFVWRNICDYFKVTAEEMRDYARTNGNESAYGLLLLGGYDFFAGTCAEYDELLEEFKKGGAQ